MNRIIHLATDEKFIKEAYKSFSNINGIKNEFIIFSNEEKLLEINFESKHFNWNYLANPNFVEHLNVADLIMIHFLDVRYYQLLNNKTFTSKILWIGWGADYYWLIDTIRGFNILKDKTAKKFAKLKNIKYLTTGLKLYLKLRRKKRMKILNRINYFAPVLKEDYDLICRNYPNFHPKYVKWNYGTIEDFIGDYVDFTVNENNILIGNSATITNNHLDVFETLKIIDTSENAVIIPLNYGNLEYGSVICQQANQLFNSRVTCIRDFLPYEDYLTKIIGCGNVILGHIRQQALGNILFMLYIGARLFFFKESVTYKFLVSNSLVVFTIKELEDNPELLNKVLSESIIIQQRKLLKEIWGKELNDINTLNIISLVNE